MGPWKLACVHPSIHSFIPARRYQVSEFDWKRAARIGSFGFLIYGPYQYWWYRALAKAFPSRSIPHFAAKVTANQVILGPLIVSAIFAWNLWLQGEAHAWPNKMRMDFTTTVVNGQSSNVETTSWASSSWMA